MEEIAEEDADPLSSLPEQQLTYLEPLYADEVDEEGER